VSFDVVVFGAGFAGARVCEAAARRGLSALGVVRSTGNAEALRARGVPATTDDALRVARERVGQATHAVVTFPPSSGVDGELAPLLAKARAVSYLSTTGVYEDIEGVVDDATPLPLVASPKYAAVLAAEAAYRAVGAAVLRSPGIYGPERGIQVRLLRGDFKLSGDGSRYGSRIHVEDLAAGQRRQPGRNLRRRRPRALPPTRNGAVALRATRLAFSAIRAARPSARNVAAQPPHRFVSRPGASRRHPQVPDVPNGSGSFLELHPSSLTLMTWLTIALLIVSNVFMTFAWYGHLKQHQASPLWIVVLVSWGIAFFEYCFQVPANRLGAKAGLETAQLKTIQEVITLAVFVAFSAFYLGEQVRWNHVVGFGFVAVGALFVFKPW
jgi:uncharacterized protein (DUF486 family)